MADTFEHRAATTASSMLRLSDFLHDCVGSASCEEADRVREALVLLPQAPERSLAVAHAIERMLDAGAALSAMLAIIGPDAPFMLSCGEGQACMATILASDGCEEITGEGTTPALALLAAHVSACLVGLERCVALGETSSASRSARLH